MQKITLIILSLIFIFGLSACSQKVPEVHKDTNSSTSAAKQTIPQNIIQKVCFQPNAVPLETELQKKGITPGTALYIRIFKLEKKLELWAKKEQHYILVKSYPICAYSGYLGPKQKEGDKQAPEGVYALTEKSLHPNSSYHLALNIQYPNRYDRRHHRSGNLIMIHGKCSSTGCFAMGNIQIEEIYKMVEAAFKKGEKFIYVAIYPFRMKEERLRPYKENDWYPFWQNLKIGYDMFEQTHVPPFVGVQGTKYVFRKRGTNLTQN